MILPKILKKYLNPIFVETGTEYGDCIKTALELGCAKIVSIEINESAYMAAVERFKNFPQVELHLGDSKDILPSVCESLNERVTFWLDAHVFWSSPNETDHSLHCGFEKNIPLLSELKTIKEKCKRNDNTILIDDMRELKWSGVGVESIMSGVMDINRNYKMIFENSEGPGGDTLKKNILTAR